MTTAPKTTRYRIRKLPITPAAVPEAEGAEGAMMSQEDGFDPAEFPPVTDASGGASDGAASGAESGETLSGWQLRLARRVARKHGLEVESDMEAVHALRARGIDPFDRAALLPFDTGPDAGGASENRPESTPDPAPVPATNIAPIGARARAQLPLKVAPAAPPRPAPPISEADRVREIMQIQRDIARRRRRKLMMLCARLAACVLLPTLIVGWYYFGIATPMYATKSEFVIQKADGLTSAAGGLGGLFAGTQLATNQDLITVQSYLQSRDAMLKLDAEQGFKAHFQQADIDRLQRLAPDATNEKAYKLYERNVKIGYDPSEGVIRMEVIAADPESSRRFSQALISYAEQQVDRLTARLREDQMRGARESYDDAEAKVVAAQDKVLSLQQKVGVLDPVSENALVMEQIATLQTQRQAKRLELSQLLANSTPNQARVQGARGDIERLEASISGLRQQLTEQTGAGESLASVTGQLRIAEAELQTRQALLATAAQQMEASRIEANKQVRYLETGVRPIAPDEATYPRAFEDTLLAFLIFSGIYLMLSLTASILREQVSS